MTEIIENIINLSVTTELAAVSNLDLSPDYSFEYLFDPVLVSQKSKEHLQMSCFV